MRAAPSLLFLALLLASASPAYAGPDLAVEVDVQQAPYDPDSGTVEVTFTATVSNVGDQACASLFWFDFWPEFTCPGCIPAGGCGSSVTKESTEFALLEPGGEPYVLVEKRTLVPNALPYHYLAFVDSVFDMCKEDNEENNIACEDYVVSVAAGKADLELTDCIVEPSLESAGDVLFSATVTNVGNEATGGSVNVEFYLDKPGNGWQDFEGELGDTFALLPADMQPGASLPVTATVACPAKDYSGACAVNVFKETDEPDYSNNYEFSGGFTCVEAMDNPDLVITDFTAKLVQGTPVYEGAVGNYGTMDVLPEFPFKLGIWYHKPGGPDLNTCPDVAAGEGTVIVIDGGLESGEEADFAWAAPHLPNGFYESWVVADCDGEIFEMDEKNNEATADLLVDEPGPDLQVIDYETTLVEEESGFRIDYTLWVQNVGTDPAGPFYVDIFWDADHEPTFEEVSNGGLEGAFVFVEEGLEPGAVRVAEFSWDVTDGIPEGDYTSWVILDITDDVPETSEANNALDIAVTVPPFITGFPNLYVETFTAKALGNNAEYFIVVGNSGDKDAKAFRIDLFVDQEGQPVMGDQGDFHQTVEGLAAGKTVAWSPSWENLDDGEYRAYVVLDTDLALEETVEGDNVAGPRYVVICGSCNACPEGEYVTSACVCGEETVNYGFCCDSSWYAVGCPDEVEGGGELVTDDDASVVEFGGNGFGAADPGCGCRINGMPVAPAGPALLLLLVALLGLGMRRRGHFSV